MLSRLALLTFFCCSTSVALARIGESQAQVEARYGAPEKQIVPESILKGARHLVFKYQGWRITCALLRATDGDFYVVRQRYMRVPTSTGEIEIKDYHLKAVLDGESNGMQWSAKAPLDSSDAHRTIQNLIAPAMGLVTLTRTDGATAVVNSRISVTVELPSAAKYEAEMKSIQEKKDRTATPKF